MTRRNFLRAVGVAAAALVADPELALWKPGAKTIVLPPATGWKLPAVSDKQIGISLRYIREYDIAADRFSVKLDVLYGMAVLRPDLAMKLIA